MALDRRTVGPHDLFGLFHRRSNRDEMDCIGCGHLFISLNSSIVQRFGIASRHHQILLIDQPLLDAFVHIVTANTVAIGHIDRSLDEIIPTVDLLGPKFEGLQQMQWRTIGQRQLSFAERDVSLHGRRIVIHVGVLDKIINAIHLQRDGFADHDLPVEHLITKYTVVFGNSRVR